MRILNRRKVSARKTYMSDHPLKGRPKSAETRAKMSAAQKGRVITAEQRAKISATLKGRPLPPDAPQRQKGRKTPEATKEKLRQHRHTEETKERISATMKKLLSSPEARAALSERTKMSDAARTKMSEMMQFYVKGGETAEIFAAVLCPAGFVREHRVQWSDHGFDYFRLDFAHLEGKVCIELDGPYHEKRQEYDAMRDAILRAMGWRVIHIRHERFEDK